MPATLYINGQRADMDTSDRLGVRIFRNAPNKEIGKTQGDYTLNLSLPRTDNNARILGFIGTVQQSRPYGTGRVLNASIQQDGTEVLSGVLIINELSKTAYKGFIKGDNIGWTEYIGDKRLSELTFDTVRYSGVRGTNRNAWPSNAANTVALHEIWQTLESDGDFCMPLVAYGNFPCDPTSGLYNPLDANTLLINSGGERLGAVVQADKFTFADFMPAVYMRKIVAQILREAGYSASGEFFTDNNLFGLATPYTGPSSPRWNWGLLGSFEYDITGSQLYATGVSDQLPNISTYTNGGPAAIRIWFLGSNSATTTTAQYDYSDGFTQLVHERVAGALSGQMIYQWYAPEDGEYTITLEVTIDTAEYTATAGTLPAYFDRLLIALHRFDGPRIIPIVSLTGVDSFTDGGYIPTGTVSSADILAYDTYTVVAGPDGRGSQSFTITYTGQFVKGDAVAPILCSYYLGGGTATVSTQVAISSITWGVTSNERQDLQPANFLPDMTQREFLQAVFKMFNVVPIVNQQSKTVYLNFAKSYYLPSSTAKDWSDKADWREITTSPVDQSNTYVVTYKVEEDEYFLTTEDAQVKFLLTNNSPTSNGQTTIEIPFAQTPNRPYYFWDFASNDTEIVLLGCINNRQSIAATLGQLGSGEVTRGYDYLPRIMRYAQPYQLINFPIVIDGEEIRETYVGPNYTGNSPIPSLYGSDFAGIEMTGVIYPTYWKQEIQDRLNGMQGSVVAYLEPSDVAAMDGRTPVRIGSTVWYITAISGYNPNDKKPVAVKLMRR